MHNENNNKLYLDLKKLSNDIRILIVEMLYRIGPEYKGHPGPALSIADIVTCLYFKIMNINPSNPKWEDRDRFILSKGHACPVVYAALAKKGFFELNHLYTLRHLGSILQGHPDMNKTPGIDMTAGSLGHGLGAGVGMALAAGVDHKSYKTYVIVGDGELQEGIIWEAAMAAGHYKLKNLVMIVDRNKWQSCDSVENSINIEPLSSKFESFGWKVVEIDGHNIKEIIEALTTGSIRQPYAVIANTIKGKGVSFMENNNSWHQRSISKEEYEAAVSELKSFNY